MNRLKIIINGNNEVLDEKGDNIIIISQKDKIKINQDCTLLQTDFKSIDDLIKAEKIINTQLKPIDEIIIINKNIDLNMISYQYNYEHVKDCYLALSNIIFFINSLIKSFNKKVSFILYFEKNSHFKVHNDNINQSLINYLNIFRKDLKERHKINIKKLN